MHALRSIMDLFEAQPDADLDFDVWGPDLSGEAVSFLFLASELGRAKARVLTLEMELRELRRGIVP